jgi:6-phosphogluconolactonase (cycloisomerase 2 family)
MKISVKQVMVRSSLAMAAVCVASSLMMAAAQPHYLITNDDNPATNSVTFYAIAPNGNLSLTQTVLTAGLGIGGGFFPANRVSVLNAAGNQCVFVSDAGSGDISAININTLALAGSTVGSQGDTGTSNGIGLATNGQYLYASFTDSNTIGTFQIQSGCSLTFVNDVAVVGLQGGVVDGLAVRQNFMIATYGDGSIESFNLASGVPVSNGDKQISTGTGIGNNYPSGIDISSDGHFAIFGDTSTAMLIEVSDISSGKLTKTVPYKTSAGISSSNIMLSPDESILYISNTQGDQVTAAFWDKTLGKPTGKGCVTGKIVGYSTDWSYLGGLGLASGTGTGSGIYVAEFGAPASIAMLTVSSANGKCSIAEASNSPVADAASPGLISIETFPPRAF